MWPPDAELLAAWRVLVADPDVGGAFADLAFGPLAADLARRFPRADPADLDTAAGDSLLAFLKRPARYDPGRSPLPAFLRLIARRKLSHLLAAGRRHRAGRIPWDAVEDDLPGRNPEGAGDDLPGLDAPGVKAAIDDLSGDDRVVWELMLDGESKTPVFAAALGLADRPAAEQAAAVYRVKDRIKQRLKRAGRKS